MELHLLSRTAALAAIAIAALTSCEERINIETGSAAPRLVIYGYITSDTARHAIRITSSADYFSTDKPWGVSGATVVIHHKEEVYPLTESTSEPGLYLTQTMAGEVGETYVLRVAADFDHDGRPEQYEAESLLPPAPQLDSMAVEDSRLSERLKEVMIWGRLPEQEINYFNVRLYRNGQLLNDSLQGFSISSDEMLRRKTIEGLSVFYLNQERDEYALTSGDSLTLRMEGVTGEYATFISNAQAERRGSLPLFSSPPANIETNLRVTSPDGVRVAGFFTAFSADSVSMVY